ncbi:MAG: hypothetical protein ACKN82_20870, partial [Pirellula sp.]
PSRHPHGSTVVLNRYPFRSTGLRPVSTSTYRCQRLKLIPCPANLLVYQKRTKPPLIPHLPVGYV